MPAYRSVPRKAPVVASEPASYRGKAAENPQPDLSELKKDELVALADERGFDSSGTKADILARLG